jgi:SAM-dependent methyltransferase
MKKERVGCNRCEAVSTPIEAMEEKESHHLRQQFVACRWLGLYTRYSRCNPRSQFLRKSVVMSGLCFSELTEDESVFTLKEVKRILKPGGILLIADDVMPNSTAKRILNRLTRFLLVIITYLITQTATKAVKNLPEKIKESGLLIDSVRLNRMESFVELIGRKPEEGTR